MHVCAPPFLEGLYMTGAFLAQEQIILESPRKKNQTELQDKMTGKKSLLPLYCVKKPKPQKILNIYNA